MTAITSSADGTKLAATVYGGQIYTSTDSGVTWTALPSSPSAVWQSITSSADGTKLAAAVLGGPIYTSIDSGATWTPRDSSRSWRSVTSSADGTKLAAVESNGGDRSDGDHIYTSSDSGATWTARGQSGLWTSITSSSDGAKLAAVTYTSSIRGQIYTSTDSGTTWATSSAPEFGWVSIASSADGSKLVAIGYSSSSAQIYTSTDSGATWIVSSAPMANYQSVTSSADGTKLAATVSDGPGYNGPIYISSDSGATWTPIGPNHQWGPIASLANGTEIVAAEFGGPIYTMSNTPTTVHRSGTIASSTPIRRYTANTVVGTRDFTNTGTNWIVQADGASVNLSSSIYNTGVDTFQQLIGGSFVVNPSINGGAAVVPQISISSPASSTSPSVVKWLPSVNWDTSTLCQYSYDDFATMHTVNCSNNGSDIGKPASGTQTLYVQGTDSRGDLTQKAATFVYDNTSPVYTSCGSDLLDEFDAPVLLSE